MIEISKSSEEIKKFLFSEEFIDVLGNLAFQRFSSDLLYIKKTRKELDQAREKLKLLEYNQAQNKNSAVLEEVLIKLINSSNHIDSHYKEKYINQEKLAAFIAGFSKDYWYDIQFIQTLIDSFVLIILVYQEKPLNIIEEYIKVTLSKFNQYEKDIKGFKTLGLVVYGLKYFFIPESPMNKILVKNKIFGLFHKDLEKIISNIRSIIQ